MEILWLTEPVIHVYIYITTVIQAKTLCITCELTGTYTHYVFMLHLVCETSNLQNTSKVDVYLFADGSEYNYVFCLHNHCTDECMCLYHAGTCIAMYFCFVFETEEWNSNIWPEVFFSSDRHFPEGPPLSVSLALCLSHFCSLCVCLSLCCKPYVIKL